MTTITPNVTIDIDGSLGLSFTDVPLVAGSGEIAIREDFTPQIALSCVIPNALNYWSALAAEDAPSITVHLTVPEWETTYPALASRDLHMIVTDASIDSDTGGIAIQAESYDGMLAGREMVGEVATSGNVFNEIADILDEYLVTRRDGVTRSRQDSGLGLQNAITPRRVGENFATIINANLYKAGCIALWDWKNVFGTHYSVGPRLFGAPDPVTGIEAIGNREFNIVDTTHEWFPVLSNVFSFQGRRTIRDGFADQIRVNFDDGALLTSEGGVPITEIVQVQSVTMPGDAGTDEASDAAVAVLRRTLRRARRYTVTVPIIPTASVYDTLEVPAGWPVNRNASPGGTGERYVIREVRHDLTAWTTQFIF